jgi:selenocysteine-specific elongation factor
MLAGVGGIDLAMLVIAADEGVMPQTREHLAICSLLRIKAGLIALTKADLVEPDWRELVREDVAGVVRGTFLEGAPIIPVSSKTGQGLDELRAALRSLAASVPQRGTDELPRLPIDRVFTVRGFGTVVTGTLTAGVLAADDRVEVYPKHAEAKIRGLQAHGQPVASARAGQRTAINLQGLERTAIARGDVVGLPGTLVSSTLVDGTFELLPDAPRAVKTRTRVRFHVGTSEIMARALLLDRAELAPGETAFARFRLEAPLVARPGDRFVVRSYSPIVTIGGGTLLDDPPRFKRKGPALVAHLELLQTGRPDAVLEEHVRHVGSGGVRLTTLAGRCRSGLSVFAPCSSSPGGRPCDQHRSRLVLSIPIASAGCAVSSPTSSRRFTVRTRSSQGCPARAPRPRGGADERVFAFLLSSSPPRGPSRPSATRCGSPHEVACPRAAAGHGHPRGRFSRAEAAPPSPEERWVGPGSVTRGAQLFQVLVQSGKLVRVKESLFFHAQALESIQTKLVALLRERKDIGPSDIKDLLGISEIRDSAPRILRPAPVTRAVEGASCARGRRE